MTQRDDPMRWYFLGKPSSDGHKFFNQRCIDGSLYRWNDGQPIVYFCDDSGIVPSEAEDGVLWVDVSDARPILQGHKDIFHVPCSNARGDTSYFLASPVECLWLIKHLRENGQRRIRIHTTTPRSDALAECFRITEAAEKGLGYGV